MEKTPARRHMENLYVSSTTAFKTGREDRFPETRKPTGGRQDVSFSRSSVDMFAMASTASASESAGLRKASIQTNFTDPLEEQLYWRGYTSDEEAASPADDESDTESITSTSSGEIIQAVPARSSLTFPDGVILSMNAAERQCLRARAVNLEPVGIGRPRRVSLVDIPASPHLQRTSPTSPVSMRLPVSRLQRIDTQRTSQHRSNASDVSTPRTSTDKSPVSTPSTPPTSGDERSFSKSIRRKPSMPVMRATYIPSSRSAYNLDHFEETPSIVSTRSPTQPMQTSSDPLVPTRQRLHKTYSSSLTLSYRDAHIYRTASDSRTTAPEVYIPRRQPPEPQTQHPRPRTSSKMLPRGANERAPPLVLPPCPDDLVDDEDPVEKQVALKRQGRVIPRSYEPTGAPPYVSRTDGRGKLHKKVRSVPHQGILR